MFLSCDCTTGAAYVFLTYDSGLTWTQQQILMASNGAANDRFGVALAVQNDTIVVGAQRHDSDKGTLMFLHVIYF